MWKTCIGKGSLQVKFLMVKEVEEASREQCMIEVKQRHLSSTWHEKVHFHEINVKLN
jgi:hypothetical protein